MSDTDRDNTPGSSDPARPGETPADPAYAGGAGYTGDATGAAPPTAGPDPLGGGAAPTDPATGSSPRLEKDPPATAAGFGGDAGGGGATAAPQPSVGASDEDKTMVLVTHIANAAGPFTGGLSNLGALILAFVKKDTAPEWARSHYIFAIRTVVIAFIACIALAAYGFVSTLLIVVGIGVLLLGIFPLLWLALGAWVVARGVVGAIKANRSEPYPNPETWLI